MKNDHKDEQTVTLTNGQITTLTNALIEYVARLQQSEQQSHNDYQLLFIRSERNAAISILEQLESKAQERQHSYLPGTSYDY